MNVPLPGQYATNEHVRGFYLREWGRFLHNNLDNAPSLVNPDKGNSLSIDFRASWKDNIDPLHNDIMEFDNGKGLQVNTIVAYDMVVTLANYYYWFQLNLKFYGSFFI